MVKFLKCFLIMAMFSIAMISFAEDAPVYDADNLPRQFEGQPDAMVSASAGHSLSYSQRIETLEQQLTNMRSLTARIDTLQTEVQTLRGQIEDLTHQLQQAQSQQRAMYSDLDKRVSNVNSKNAIPPIVKKTADVASTDDDVLSSTQDNNEKAPLVKAKKIDKPVVVSEEHSSEAVVADHHAKSSDTQPSVAEEQQTYQTAFNLIKAKKYNEAVVILQKMLQKYPSGQFAANAHYWLGELYGLMGKNDQSATEFLTVVKKYPDSPKIADSQLKLGLIYVAQLKWPDAKVIFKKVNSKYPGSPSARLAQEQLKQLKQAGH